MGTLSSAHATQFKPKTHFTLIFVFVCVLGAVSARADSVDPQYELVKVEPTIDVLELHKVTKELPSPYATNDTTAEELSKKDKLEAERDVGSKTNVPVVSFSTRGAKSRRKAKKFIIGVPKDAMFPSFVMVKQENYSGLCIELFRQVAKSKKFVNYEFQAQNGSYEHIVDLLHNKSLNAIVGDFTITSKRLEKNYFTSSYMDSSIVLRRNKNWKFQKPFTKEVWLVGVAVLVYIMFAVWFMERRESQDFSGTYRNQIGTTICFTLMFDSDSSVSKVLSRMVVIVWLVTVLILSSNYTASLSSMLTTGQLRPATDLRWLLENNKAVGCDSSSFIRDYLIQTLRFNPNNVKNISNSYDYYNMLKNGSVSAIILERPYQKAFFKDFNPKQFVLAENHNITFEGLAFGFAKKSKLFDKVSQKILNLTETGEIKRMQTTYFSSDDDYYYDGKLGVDDFWVLFILPVVAVSILVVIIQRV